MADTENNSGSIGTTVYNAASGAAIGALAGAALKLGLDYVAPGAGQAATAQMTPELNDQLQNVVTQASDLQGMEINQANAAEVTNRLTVFQDQIGETLKNGNISEAQRALLTKLQGQLASGVGGIQELIANEGGFSGNNNLSVKLADITARFESAPVGTMAEAHDSYTKSTLLRETAVASAKEATEGFKADLTGALQTEVDRAANLDGLTEKHTMRMAEDGSVDAYAKGVSKDVERAATRVALSVDTKNTLQGAINDATVIDTPAAKPTFTSRITGAFNNAMTAGGAGAGAVLGVGSSGGDTSFVKKEEARRLAMQAKETNLGNAL